VDPCFVPRRSRRGAHVGPRTSRRAGTALHSSSPREPRRDSRGARGLRRTRGGAHRAARSSPDRGRGARRRCPWRLDIIETEIWPNLIVESREARRRGDARGRVRVGAHHLAAHWRSAWRVPSLLGCRASMRSRRATRNARRFARLGVPEARIRVHRRSQGGARLPPRHRDPRLSRSGARLSGASSAGGRRRTWLGLRTRTRLSAIALRPAQASASGRARAPRG
jgi:hypothetical protein